MGRGRRRRRAPPPSGPLFLRGDRLAVLVFLGGFRFRPDLRREDARLEAELDADLVLDLDRDLGVLLEVLAAALAAVAELLPLIGEPGARLLEDLVLLPQVE